MIDVAALTGGRRAPSARFRIRQLIEPLADLGVRVREFPNWVERDTRLPGPLRGCSPALLRPLRAAWTGLQIAARLPGCLRSRFADIVWIERCLLSSCSVLEQRLPRPRVLDVDDAIWLSHPFVRQYAADVDLIIAGNSFIADWFSKFGRPIRIVPTAIDTEKFFPRLLNGSDASDGKHAEADMFVIGWSGTQANLKYVYDIEQPLARFLERHADARLLIQCNAPPQFSRIPPDRWQFHRWTPANEAAVIRRFDVGLMPLRDGEWERGKCSLKMLQYMASGVPVVVSPVGTNIEVAAHGPVGFLPSTTDDWHDALETIFQNPSQRHAFSLTGRRIAEQLYSSRHVAIQIATAVQELCGNGKA